MKTNRIHRFLDWYEKQPAIPFGLPLLPVISILWLIARAKSKFGGKSK